MLMNSRFATITAWSPTETARGDHTQDANRATSPRPAPPRQPAVRAGRKPPARATPICPAGQAMLLARAQRGHGAQGDPRDSDKISS